MTNQSMPLPLQTTVEDAVRGAVGAK